MYANTIFIGYSSENFSRAEAQVTRMHRWNSQSCITISWKIAKTHMCNKTQTEKIQGHKESHTPQRETSGVKSANVQTKDCQEFIESHVIIPRNLFSSCQSISNITWFQILLNLCNFCSIDWQSFPKHWPDVEDLDSEDVRPRVLALCLSRQFNTQIPCRVTSVFLDRATRKRRISFRLSSNRVMIWEVNFVHLLSACALWYHCSVWAMPTSLQHDKQLFSTAAIIMMNEKSFRDTLPDRFKLHLAKLVKEKNSSKKPRWVMQQILQIVTNSRNTITLNDLAYVMQEIASAGSCEPEKNHFSWNYLKYSRFILSKSQFGLHLPWWSRCRCIYQLHQSIECILSLVPVYGISWCQNPTSFPYYCSMQSVSMMFW